MGSVIATLTAVGLSLLAVRPTDIVTFFKWIVSYAYIEYHRRTTKKRFDLYDFEATHDPEKLDFLPPQFEYDLESPQPESHLSHAADEVFFYGVNSHSECLITRIARTVNDETEAWVYLKLKDGKVYRLKETSGYQNSSSDVGKEFTCGGLRINYMKPMRRWRIFYNGILRETSETDSTVDRMVYVKLALIWRASSDCFDSTSDINSVALAWGLARSKWENITPPLGEFNESSNFYAQAGNITGTVQVGEGSDEQVISFFGERTRFLGSTSLEKGVQFTHVLGQISKTGSVFHIGEVNIPNVVSKLRFGFVVFSNGSLSPVSDANMLFEKENDEILHATFHVNKLKFEVQATVFGKQARFESKKGWDGSLTIRSLKIRLDDHLDGQGVILEGELTKPSLRRTVKKTGKVTLEDVPVAVHFSEGLCEISEVTGGKGSSLGKLTQLSKELQNFIVPNGIVVTTSAYGRFLNREIRTEIENLENVLYGKVEGDVKEACHRVMEEVTKTKIPDQVFQAISKCLQKSFGDQLLKKKFAVRSSATGEDTEQMSAAGQMETYLGVSGLEEIISAVQKCWASQFGFVAVEYKRQKGQEINSPMAVVIQEMISCDVAGVLFTCDPLTGNTTLMSITANYGLGESVVSGSEEPDAIVLERKDGDQLTIREKIIGAKSRRIVMKEDGGTILEEVPERDKQACCLSDALVLRLGKIAVQIEKNYRSNRDVEWGYWNNNLYIFQSRPITSGTGETEFEIDHETDTTMRIEHEYFTVCNVGEVMPGAMTHLGLDVLFKCFEFTFRRLSVWQSDSRANYFRKGMCNMYNHVMFSTVELLEHISEGRQVIEASMIGLFGRVIEDEELYEVAMERYGRKKKMPWYKKYYEFLIFLFAAATRLKRAVKRYANYHIPFENLNTSKEVFDVLMYSCDDLHEALVCHMTASQSSTLWNMFVISILQKAKGGMCSEVYRDFSKLLASINEVESADVPAALQSLAYSIGKDFNPEEFKKMKNEEIAAWLKSSPTEAGTKFRDFLKKHGHRCLKEFDLRSITWGTNPSLLIELLKNLVGNVKDVSTKKPEDADKILAEMQLGLKQRMFLKFLLPRCRSAVQLREKTKSLLIKGMDECRKGYRYLAKLMVSEGRIPEEDLLYFMLLEDIRELLSNRSPKIVSRATHRRRRHPELDKYIFPEIMKGFPYPVNLYDAPVTPTKDDFMMKGIPVSQGIAKGFVRVALTLEEASNIKPGEILLTYSTDIGWTPYFPALAGVVTELGGLISHGAVVSREYGLPCIAGLHGATRQFQTGDYVLLDGNRGILQKITPPENQ